MEVETLRGNFTETQALQIRHQERSRGNYVNIRRLHSKMLEIEIIHQDNKPVSPEAAMRVINGMINGTATPFTKPRLSFD